MSAGIAVADRDSWLRRAGSAQRVVAFRKSFAVAGGFSERVWKLVASLAVMESRGGFTAAQASEWFVDGGGRRINMVTLSAVDAAASADVQLVALGAVPAGQGVERSIVAVMNAAVPDGYPEALALRVW